MTDGSETDVLGYLREQFARVNANIDSMAEDLRSVKVRLTAVESEIGLMRVSIAGVHSRLDRVELRLDRIERRLELTDA